MISLLAERDGVIGIVPFNRFLKPGWAETDARDALTLQDIASAIDHVCQITGSARHVGIGTDFDGGFGVEQVPEGIDTIADLQHLIPLLSERGYSEDEVMGIMHGNWLRLLNRGLPD
jgi:membrane dipeptidase